MNVQKEIDILIAEIRKNGSRIRWLRQHQSALEKAPDATFWMGGLDFNNMPHKEIIRTVKALGGKWKKEPSATPEKIDYVTQVDGVQVRCWAGEPPPSCRIVEVEETIPEKVIPAHTRKVKKLVCKPELAAEIAVARDPLKAQTPATV